MPEDDITQVKVGGRSVGLTGLKRILEETERHHVGCPERDVEKILLNRASEENYIPESARRLYGAALLREYKKFIGEKTDEEADALQELDIKVLGPGCASCDGLEAAVMAVLRDVKQIARYGVMATPALVINGRAVCAGKAPSKEQIKARLAELVGRSCEKIVKTH